MKHTKSFTETFSDKKIKAALNEVDQHPVYHVITDDSYEIPDYNDRDYAIMANQDINRRVLLRGSKQYFESEYMLSRVTHLPRSIDQRIGGGSNTRWNNLVKIYNFFADELGYDKITVKNTQTRTPKPMRIWDEKEHRGDWSENMVYMSDGMWIHKDDCWW